MQGRDARVVLVTEGVFVAYPPEVYRSAARALSEAHRWASLIRDLERSPILPLSDSAWSVGEFVVHAIDSVMPGTSLEPWIGTYWTQGGTLGPEAEIFPDRPSAQRWVIDAVPGRNRIELHETPWSIRATFQFDAYEEHAVVQKAKMVR
jgi:hypothetical protein